MYNKEEVGKSVGRIQARVWSILSLRSVRGVWVPGVVGNTRHRDSGDGEVVVTK